ncbi:MAG: hypothetical protein AAB394_00165 [Patescibacteria group bacterium]
MNQKGFIKDVVIIVLAILLLGGGYFYLSKKPAYVPEEMTNKDVSAEISYKNEKYGFELVLPNGYKGYDVSETNQVEYYGLDSKSLDFNVDSSGTTWPYGRFSVFIIAIYPLDWWNKNAFVDTADNTTYKKEADQNASNYLGLFLGKNEKYVFTWFRGQDCPRKLGTDEYTDRVDTIQCKLFTTSEDVLKTFKIIK